MPFFSKVFKSKDPNAKDRKHAVESNGLPQEAPKPRWEESWSRTEVQAQEIQELVHVCSLEMKSRALDTPFLLLPFRPGVDQSAAKLFVRNFFKAQYEGSHAYRGERLHYELRLTDPMVLCSILKWCWSRLPGGVVTWDVYEMFRIGENDSGMARHAFDTFIPLGVENDTARKHIIFDFFDLLAAIAARGKTNGLGGRKLSRMAGWWAFDFTNVGVGFEGGYKSWANAADACSHLFFAYLRSQSPDALKGVSGISQLPRSLQALVSQTEYPPETPTLMQTRTSKVIMIVGSVSPTPFTLLRRAKQFSYRDDDRALQEFSQYDDPVQALTDECRRVLKSIASTNEKSLPAERVTNGAGLGTWSNFEDLGFSNFAAPTGTTSNYPASISGDGSQPWGKSRSHGDDLGRPTTPSWADFLSDGFSDTTNHKSPGTHLLPPDKSLPPIAPVVRVRSSQSHVKHGLQDQPSMEPGELASITAFDLDETFWWVWISSLASEEPSERKAVFGRCALIETHIPGGRWLVMEEQVKGAAPEPAAGAYIAEKKSKFSWTRRGRLGRNRSQSKKPVPPPIPEPLKRAHSESVMSKRSLAPDQAARVQAAALKLKQNANADREAARRGRQGGNSASKTNSVLTLQPHIMSEAAPAMKWAKAFDKNEIRSQYLNDKTAGTGRSREDLLNGSTSQLNLATNGTTTPVPKAGTSRRNSVARTHETAMPIPPQKTATPISRPLPNVPKSQPSEDVAIKTAEVPLPPPIVDEKPSDVEASPVEKHSALRQASPPQSRKPLAPTSANTSEGAVEAARRAYEAKYSNQDPEKQNAKKLKKGSATGFKGLFGRKSYSIEHEEPAQPPHQAGENPQAPAGGAKLGRNLSLLRKKSPASTAIPESIESHKHKTETAPPVPASPAAVAAATAAVAAAATATTAAVPAVVAHDSPVPTADQVPEAVAHDAPIPNAAAPPAPIGPAPAPPALREEATAKQDHPRPYSPVGPSEQKEADKAFSRFDQGPIEDMPAFVPEDSPRDATRPKIPPAPSATAPTAPVREGPIAPAKEIPAAAPRPTDVSEVPTQPSQDETPLTMQDRWAQIRKAAAERAAQQQKSGDEEDIGPKPSQSRSQIEKTDDGDTSGEETIEARIARIKARVAETIGNDSNGNATRLPVRR